MRHLLSLLGAMLSFPAVAGELRDIQGRVVPMEGPRVVVAWSITGGDAEELARLASQGPVVAVNTDGVGDRSKLAPYLHSHRLDLTVVADPSGELRARLGLVGPVVAVVIQGEHVTESYCDSREIVSAAVAAR